MTLPLVASTGAHSTSDATRPASADAGAFATVLGAFEEVYETHFDFVWRSVRRLGIQLAAVDDAVQDVFVVVHRRGGEFEGRSSVKTWLFGIVVHVVRAYRRRRTIEATVDPEELVDSAARSPYAQMEAAEAMRTVYDALDALDEAKREVLVLMDLEEMTAPEAAEALGIKLNTVYSRLRAARYDFDAEVARRAARDGWRLP